MIRPPFRAAFAALLVSSLLAGCSPGSRPVARIGTRTVTVDDLTFMARGNEGSFPAPPEQARQMFLEQVIGQEVLREAGRSLGMDTTANARKFRRATEDQLLLQALQLDLASAAPGVSEAEARRFWADRTVQSDVQLVFTYDEPSIRRARAAVDAGQPFADVANRFNPPNALAAGGAYAAILPGWLPPVLDDALRRLPAGAVGGPYESPQGWFLLRIVRRSPVTPQPFELQRASLEEILRQRKARSALDRAILDLQREYHMTLKPDGAAAVFRYLEPFRIASGAHWVPDANERRQVLATFDGGAYTLEDALTDLDRSDLQKPHPGFEPGLARWLQDRVGVRIALAEARRRHLNEEPAFVRGLENRVGQYVLQSVYNVAVAGVGAPPEAESRRMWEAVKASNPQLRQARVAWVVVPDTALARAILLRRASGATLAAAVAEIAPAMQVRVETLHFPTQDPVWSAMAPVIGMLAPGQWSDPQFVGTGWHLMQLLEKDQVTLTWEQLTPEMRSELGGRMQQMLRDARLGAYRDSLMRAINPVPVPENLRFVAWPVAPPVAVGS